MRKFALVLGLVVVIMGGIAWAMRHPEIPEIARPDPSAQDPSEVERGEQLAGIGNCKVCHTREGGLRFSGGLALPTPFGTIYTSNLTPDPDTGIGTWSEEAFVRAMRHGVDREGRYLYPAFPYDYFARVSDDDLGAIYAYLMSLEPVAYEPPENELGFPFDQRFLMAGWNLMFHDDTPFRPQPDHDDEWNRGAYLVEGLGHCGACHSSRNALGAAAKTGSGAYAGGEAEGWTVPPLDASAPAPVPWTQIALVNYLIDGWDADHGIAAGPMRPIVDDLYEQSEDDVFAIAAYLMSLKGGGLSEDQQSARVEGVRPVAEALAWGHADAPQVPDDPILQSGAAVFEAQCVTCHKAGGESVPLALTTVVNGPSADNFVNVVFNGIQPPRGSPDRSMPARALQISDAEMAALASFVRARFSTLPPWQGLDASISAARAAGKKQ